LSEIPPALTERSGADLQVQIRWGVGLSVRHPQFGVGVVTDLTGSGDELELTVTFSSRHGTKLVKPKLTRLRVIDGQ
jgi:DNA helicase-2/ATP-dependent DNA helicase PcrA